MNGRVIPFLLLAVVLAGLTRSSVAVSSQAPRSRRVLGQPFVANLALPRAKAPYAGVLVVGGSGGGIAWQDYWGEILVRQGFAALALAYFGMEGLPKDLDEIPLGTSSARWSTCSGNLKSIARESAFSAFREEANSPCCWRPTRLPSVRSSRSSPAL